MTNKGTDSLPQATPEHTAIEEILLQLQTGTLYADNTEPAMTNNRNVAMKSITTYLQQEIAEVEKAYGGCRNCYGKGYATVIEGTTWSDTDTDIGSRGGSGKDTSQTIKYCDCPRGKQLEQEIDKARIDKLVSFVSDLNNIQPFEPLKSTPREYVEEKLKDRIVTIREGKQNE